MNEKIEKNKITTVDFEARKPNYKNLVMDYYQFTMGYANFMLGKRNDKCYFDMFFRKIPDKGGYAVSNGLDKVIEYVKNLRFTNEEIQLLRKKGDFSESYLKYLKEFRFKGDIYAVPDGTVVFPNEPLVTVRGTKIETQLIETKLLLLMNYSTLVSTKANRIVNASQGRGILEFGTRRAQGETAAIEGAKYAYIAGAIGTSCVQAEYEYGIPAIGTMAHSFIQEFDSEYEAFLAYAQIFPKKTTLLVDTYNTLKSGVPNAIRVAKEHLEPNGYKLKGIRLDSGDLCQLSKEARKMLDAAGMYDTKIIASNSLDEYEIERLLKTGAKIDIFGVGERLITAKSDPVLGGVYKYTADIKDNVAIPKIKLSDTIEKVTNPGRKETYRFYDSKTGYAMFDTIALGEEEISADEYLRTDENGKEELITDYALRKLQIPIFKNGELVYRAPTIEDRRENCRKEVETLPEDVKNLYNPRKYSVLLTPELKALKEKIVGEKKTEIANIKHKTYIV